MFRFRGPRYPPRFVSRSLRLRSREVRGCLPGRGHCSAGDPIAGLLSRGRERDLPGSQAFRSVPLPRSRTPAEPTLPRLVTVSSMLPPLPSQRGLQRNGNFGATTRLQHLLPTLHEWCCHHPCKARFRLAGSPLPGGNSTHWTATKGFRSHSRSPFLDLSWRKKDLPSSLVQLRSAVWTGVTRDTRPIPELDWMTRRPGEEHLSLIQLTVETASNS